MCRNKRILQNTAKNKAFVESLPPVYLIGYWARPGYLKCYFSGKYSEGEHTKYEPLVGNYDDHNGTADQYELIPISFVTTGYRYWTFNENFAKLMVERMRKEAERDQIKF